MVYTVDRHKEWQDNVMKIYSVWCTTVTFIQNKTRHGEKKIYICSQTCVFLNPGWHDQSKVTSKIHPGNKSKIMKGTGQ